jgi:hypothetical protein
MARIINGIHGTIIGSVGNFVYRFWKGKNFIQSKPLNFNDPKTELQIKQRTRFSACTKLGASALDKTIQKVWGKKDKECTWLQLFIHINIHAFDITGKIASYENLQFSVGDLPLPENISIQNKTGSKGDIQISWTDNSGYKIAASTDQLKVLSICGEEVSLLQGLNATRATQMATVSIPGESGNVVHLYLFFINEKKMRGSANFYQKIQIL